MGGDWCGSVKLCKDAGSIITWTRSKNNEKITPPEENHHSGDDDGGYANDASDNDRASVDAQCVCIPKRTQ